MIIILHWGALTGDFMPVLLLCKHFTRTVSSSNVVFGAMRALFTAASTSFSNTAPTLSSRLLDFSLHSDTAVIGAPLCSLNKSDTLLFGFVLLFPSLFW